MSQEGPKVEATLDNLVSPCFKIEELKRAVDVAQWKGTGSNPQSYQRK